MNFIKALLIEPLKFHMNFIKALLIEPLKFHMNFIKALLIEPNKSKAAVSFIFFFYFVLFKKFN